MFLKKYVFAPKRVNFQTVCSNGVIECNFFGTVIKKQPITPININNITVPNLKTVLALYKKRHCTKKAERSYSIGFKKIVIILTYPRFYPPFLGYSHNT